MNPAHVEERDAQDFMYTLLSRVEQLKEDFSGICTDTTVKATCVLIL